MFVVFNAQRLARVYLRLDSREYGGGLSEGHLRLFHYREESSSLGQRGGDWIARSLRRLWLVSFSLHILVHPTVLRRVFGRRVDKEITELKAKTVSLYSRS